MKKNTLKPFLFTCLGLIIVAIVAIVFISPTEKPDVSAVNPIVLNDIEKDFPTTKILPFSKIQTFEIESIRCFAIKDSSIFVGEEGPCNKANCYNINSGEKLSTLIENDGKGNKTHVSSREIMFFGDSILFSTNKGSIKKAVAINDVLTKPLDERVWSTIKIPRSISAHNWRRTGENKIFGILGGLNEEQNDKYFTLDGDKISTFGDMNKGLYENEISSLNMANMLSSTKFAVNKNRTVTSLKDGLLLDVIDLDKKEITSHRYYNKIKEVDQELYNGDTFKHTDPTGDFFTSFNVDEIGCNDENIYCLARKWNTEKRKSDFFIYVFDWELNPVQKYELDLPEEHKTHMLNCCFTEDGKFYYITFAGEDATRELFMTEIK